MKANERMKRELRDAGARWRAHLEVCSDCQRASGRRPGPALFCSEGQTLYRTQQRAEQLLDASA